MQRQVTMDVRLATASGRAQFSREEPDTSEKRVYPEVVYMCCGDETWTGPAEDSSALSEHSEQSDVIMSDQQPNEQASMEAVDISNVIAAATDCIGLEHSSGNGSQPTAAAHEGTSSTAGVAKPRVFKMSDEFLMFKFKIEMCSRKDRHDWKICPYAHPGEVARRRHPRGYTAVLCPAKTAASCPRREQCTFAHNPFEFWLHPDRFKTSLCNQGPNCDRPICFFAHKDDEVRRLANGLEAAGPDDYVYATAPTPEPDLGAPLPPPPPPPRTNSLVHAGSGGLGFLQGNPMMAAAAAAAAASLNSSNLLLGASPHQLMMLGGEEALLQSAGSGLAPDTANTLCNSSWLSSNSDPSLLTTVGLAAQAQQLSGVTSPVPLPHNAAGSRAFRNSLSSSGMMGMSLDQAAALAGLDACMLAGMQGMSHGHQLSGNGASLTNAVNMASAGAATGMAGSAPAGYTLLQGSDMSNAPAAYQQQLVLQQLIQQQALAAVNASNAGLQQLLQQQQVQLQQLQYQQQLAVAQQQQAQPQAATQQQHVQKWQNSLLASPPLAASAPASQQLLWQQQQQQLEPSQFQAGSLGSNSTPPDSNLAAAFAGAAATRMPSAVSSTQMSSTAPVYGMGQQHQQQGVLKWSSSILTKGSRSQTSQGRGDLLTQASLERASLSDNGAGVVGFLGPASAAASGVMPMTSTPAPANALDQLNGLLQMVHVSSSAGMLGPGGI